MQRGVWRRADRRRLLLLVIRSVTAGNVATVSSGRITATFIVATGPREQVLREYDSCSPRAN